MGCGWIWPDTDRARVTAIEAINGANAEGPLAGTAFRYARLDAGYRITEIAGSDNHNPDAPAGQSRIGRPTTVVHAESLSTPAILRGIRDGNVFIDVEGTRDRLLEVEAGQAGSTIAMGGTLQRSGTVRLRVHVRGAAGATIKTVGAGDVLPPRRLLTENDERLEMMIPDGAAKH